MAEEKQAPPSDEKLEQRIAKLEEMLAKNQELRGRLRLYAVGGSCLILVVLGLFAYRCISIMTNYNRYIRDINPEAVMKAFENPESDIPLSAHPDKRIDEALKYVIADAKMKIPPAVDHARTQVAERVLPEFQGLVVESFEARSDEFSKAGEELRKNLKTHAETRVKEELFDAMVDGFAQVDKELHDIFPELAGRQIEVQLKEAQPYLYDRLHAWGEEKIAQFAPILQVIDQRVQQLSDDSKIPAAKRAEMREQIFHDFLEGMLDRIKYELIPGLGEQYVEVKTPQKVNATPKGGGK